MSIKLVDRLLDPNANIEDLIISRSEDFQLEFKSRADSNQTKLTKSDKQSLSKEIGGFLNAEGGLLLFGVHSQKLEKQDIATKLQVISGVSRFRDVVQGSLSELVNPIPNGIKVHAIQTSMSEDKGILAIEVPASSNKPYTSTAPDMHRHYRRGIEGTHVMDNSQIRDCVLAPRSADFGIEVRMSMRPEQPEPWIRKMALTLMLKNVSSVAAISPFIEVACSDQVPQIGETDNIFQRREMGPLHHYGYYSSANFILHAGARVDVCTFEFYISTSSDDFASFFGWNTEASSLDWRLAWRINILEDEWSDTISKPTFEFEKLQLDISCGAVNAVRRQRKFDCDRFNMKKGLDDYVMGHSEGLRLFEVT